MPASRRRSNPALQIAALKKAKCAHIFQDKLTGATTNRPQLARCLKTLRAVLADTHTAAVGGVPIAVRTGWPSTPRLVPPYSAADEVRFPPKLVTPSAYLTSRSVRPGWQCVQAQGNSQEC